MGKNAALRFRRVGPYWYLAELARGGMAQVFAVAVESSIGLEQIAVLKRMKADLTDEEEFQQMFLDEARLAARLEHPNIVRTLDFGLEGASPFLVMEYLAGQPLSRIVAALRKGEVELSLPLRLTIVAEVLAALDYAHGLEDFRGEPMNVVHRDVTLSNVIVTYDGRVKLVDFGIATGTLRQAETGVGVLKGKAKYMAPEQHRGEKVGQRVDLFAAGVLAYELCSLECPWGDDVVRYQDRPPVRPLAELVEDIDPAIVDWVGRALAEEPEHRWPTARAMREELDRLIGPEQGPSPMKALGAEMSRAFRVDRERVTAVLRERRAEAREAWAGMTEEERREVQTQAQPPPTLLELDAQAPEPTSVSLRPPRVDPSRPLWPLLVGATISVALGAAFLLRGAASTERAPSVAPASSATTTPTEVEMYIVATPPDAEIAVDGVAVQDNPHTARFARAGSSHVVRVQANGHRTKEVEVVAGRDHVVRVRLDATD